MHESSLRRDAANDNPMVRARVLIAAVLALALMGSVASASAKPFGGSGDAVGGSGDLGGGAEPAATEECPATELGTRTLAVGDCGDDVLTLNWLLRSKHLASVSLAEEYGTATETAVREFERGAGLEVDGVFEPATYTALAESMPSQVATWYGPGFYGNQTACGQTLTKDMVGVAHKTLPCGSKVVLRHKGSYVRTTVIDRGPYANGAQWDLTEKAAELLGFVGVGVGDIQVAKLGRAKRK